MPPFPSQFKEEMEQAQECGFWVDEFGYTVYVFKTSVHIKRKEVLAQTLPTHFFTNSPPSLAFSPTRLTLHSPSPVFPRILPLSPLSLTPSLTLDPYHPPVLAQHDRAV